MRASTTLLLLAVLLVGGFIWFFERKSDATDRRQELARRALRFDPDRVAAIRVQTETLQATLEKRGDLWFLTSPVAARADAGEVSRLLDNLELLERAEVITPRQQRQQQLTAADYGLDQPRGRIVLTEGTRELALLIGRNAPLGGNLFLQAAGEASIMVASTNLLADLPASADALRDRRLFQGYPGEVTRLDLRRREGLLHLARDPQGTWRVQKPYVGRAAYAGVQQLLDRIFETRVVEFVADSFAAASLYGLDDPTAQIALSGDKKYGTQVLLLGKPVDRQPDQVYATVQGTETVVAVDKSLLATLDVRADGLRDRRLLTLPAYDIGYVAVEEGERALRLARSDDASWALVEPRQYMAHGERIQAILNEWTGLRIESFVDQPGTNLAAWGLAPPARRITFARLAPAAAVAPAVARVPSPDDEVVVAVSSLPASNGLVTVKLAHEESLYVVSDDALRTLPMDPLYYRHPDVLALDPATVRSLAVLRDGREELVEREAATNAFRASGANREADAVAVSNLLGQITRITAVDFVAEDPDDLAPYGLAAPTLTVTIGLSGTTSISKSLLLGDEASPTTVYARIRGMDAIFTVDKSVRDNLARPLYKQAPETPEKPVADAADATSREPADTAVP